MYRAALTFLLLATLGAHLSADEGDRRHKYGDGKNKDGAAYLGDQKSKDQLTPNMLQHYAESAMKFASGDIAGGQMEQMKGDMLKQQISENKKSADKNRESEKLVMDGPNDVRQQQLKGDPRVRTVDKDRASAQAAAAAGREELPTLITTTSSAPISVFSYDNVPAAPSAPRPAASEQLAQLSDVASPPAAPTAVAATESAPAPSAPAPDFSVPPPPTSASAGNLALGGADATRASTTELPPQFNLLGAATGVLDKDAAVAKQAKADAAFFAGVGREEEPKQVKSRRRRAE